MYYYDLKSLRVTFKDLTEYIFYPEDTEIIVKTNNHILVEAEKMHDFYRKLRQVCFNIKWE